MNLDKQLKWLSRQRDGELDARRAARLDKGAIRPALLDEADEAWKEIGDHLRNQSIPTPPTEVMWTDVRREIRYAREDRWAREHTRGQWNWAVVAISAIFMALLGFFSLRLSMPPEAYASEPRVEWVEAELPGSSAMVYEDKESGAVVIWLMTPDEESAGKGST